MGDVAGSSVEDTMPRMLCSAVKYGRLPACLRWCGDAKCLDSSNTIDRPPHYAQGPVECIDAIESALGPIGFIAFLRGQVMKYQWRMGRKDKAPIDAAKAHWYSSRLLKALAAEDGEKP